MRRLGAVPGINAGRPAFAVADEGGWCGQPFETSLPYRAGMQRSWAGAAVATVL
jgi:hypothetical protein